MNRRQKVIPAVTKWWCLVSSSEWSSWAPLTSIKHPFVTCDCWYKCLVYFQPAVGVPVTCRTPTEAGDLRLRQLRGARAAGGGETGDVSGEGQWCWRVFLIPRAVK